MNRADSRTLHEVRSQMICIKCHRPLKNPPTEGMGPTCARKAKVQPIPAHDRDLFGFNPALAAEGARDRVRVHIDSAAAAAYIATRDDFRRARVALLGWEAR